MNSNIKKRKTTVSKGNSSSRLATSKGNIVRGVGHRSRPISRRRGQGPRACLDPFTIGVGIAGAAGSIAGGYYARKQIQKALRDGQGEICGYAGDIIKKPCKAKVVQREIITDKRGKRWVRLLCIDDHEQYRAIRSKPPAHFPEK